MRVLIFQAATSAIAIAAMTNFADRVRAAGHTGGLRNIGAFRNEKEPADQIIVALKPSEAQRYKDQGVALVQTFGDTDRIIPVELPEKDEDLKDFDFTDALDALNDEKAGMTMDQLKAEAIERGIEVRADSTREELEHALDLDIHPGAQAVDRATDRRNMAGMATRPVGLRTSTVLPTVNGLDLERLNDEQLAGVAASVGVKVGKGDKRTTIINKITKTFAEKAGAPADSSPKAPAEDFTTDLVNLNADELTKLAADEGIDVGKATSVEGLTEKIVEARKAKAEGGSNG